MQWKEKPSLSSTESSITSYGKLLATKEEEGYGLYKAGGSFHLRLPYGNTTKLAGRYSCGLLGLPVNVHHVAHLVVLDGHPHCTDNVTDNRLIDDGQIVEFSCRIRYTGELYPVMEWSATGNLKGEVTEKSVPGKVTHQIFTVRLRKSNYGWILTCRTFFQEPRNRVRAMFHFEATNAPQYQYVYIWPLVVV